MDIPSANCRFLLSVLGKKGFGFLGLYRDYLAFLFSEGAGIASVCDSQEKALCLSLFAGNISVDKHPAQ